MQEVWLSLWKNKSLFSMNCEPTVPVNAEEVNIGLSMLSSSFSDSFHFQFERIYSTLNCSMCFSPKKPLWWIMIDNDTSYALQEWKQLCLNFLMTLQPVSTSSWLCGQQTSMMPFVVTHSRARNFGSGGSLWLTSNCNKSEMKLVCSQLNW